MINSIPALILAAQLATPVADRAPQFNTEPTCRGAATASTAIRSDRDVCMQKEQAARTELDKQWAGFPAPDRSRCVSSTAAGGNSELYPVAHVPGDGKADPRIAEGRPLDAVDHRPGHHDGEDAANQDTAAGQDGD